MKIFYSRLLKSYKFGDMAFADTGPYQQKVFQVVRVPEPQMLPIQGTPRTAAC